MKSLLCVVAAAFVILNSQAVIIYNYIIEIPKPIYREGVFSITQWRSHKLNNTAFIFSAEFEFFMDIGQDFEIEALFYYKQPTDEEFIKSENDTSKMSMCKMIEKYEFSKKQNQTLS